jgi:hypothetical protein
VAQQGLGLANLLSLPADALLALGASSAPAGGAAGLRSHASRSTLAADDVLAVSATYDGLQARDFCLHLCGWPAVHETERLKVCGRVEAVVAFVHLIYG